MTVAFVGSAFFRQGIKKHFVDTYLHIAVLASMGAALSGVMEYKHSFWPLVLAALVLASATYGFQTRKFIFVTYGILFGYAGLSTMIVRAMNWSPWIWFYYMISAGVVIFSLVRLSQRFGAES
jgi:hypothetical protein